MGRSTSQSPPRIFLASGTFLFLLAMFVLFMQIDTTSKMEKRPLIDGVARWDTTTVVKADNFHPRDIAVSKEGIIYIADSKAEGIWRWTPDSGLNSLVTGLKRPKDIVIDDSGRILCVYRDGIARIVSDGKWHNLRPQSRLPSIYDLAFDPYRDSLIILSWGKIFSLSRDGICQILQRNPRSRPFGMATALAMGPGGAFFIADYQHCIMTILPDGTSSKRHPRGGGASGDLAFSPGTGLIVADYMNKRVLRMPVSGEHFEIIYRCNRKSEIRRPCGVAIGPDNMIYVSDPTTHTVIRLKAKSIE
jgi:hypothetical protein